MKREIRLRRLACVMLAGYIILATTLTAEAAKIKVTIIWTTFFGYPLPLPLIS